MKNYLQAFNKIKKYIFGCARPSVPRALGPGLAGLSLKTALDKLITVTLLPFTTTGPPNN